MSSHVRSSLSAAAAIWLASQLTAAAQAQQPPQQIECVARTATAKPPPHPAAPRRAAANTRQGVTQKTEPAMRPLCPEGQVPVVRGATTDSLIQRQGPPLKGNPLLRPQSGVNRPASDTGAVVSPSDVRSFREIYGRAAPRVAPPPGPPGPPPPGPPPCGGIVQSGSCYYYGSAGLTRAADGGGMTMSVNRPAYVNTGGFGHTLNEISVQGGANNGNIVELGWLVSTDQYGDPDPHIFVFHWKNWVPTCYDACGWQQYSNTYFPGQNIKALLGRDVYVGYVFYEGNWWAWFDDQWLGYFPGTEWNGGYTKSALLQWFGEVASLNGIPPKTQMGDGVLPPVAKAAHMATLCDVDAKAWVCWYRDQQSLSATVPTDYDIRRVGFGETRYGGPGQ